MYIKNSTEFLNKSIKIILIWNIYEIDNSKL